MVELILEAEVGLAGCLSFGPGGILLGEDCDVAAGAEGFGASAAYYYYIG